jgi:hypothetical protein
MNLKNNILWIAVSFVVGFAVAFVLLAGKEKHHEQHIKVLRDSIAFQNDSIRARDLLIDSLSQEQIKADGLITDLNIQVIRSRQLAAKERGRIDKLNNHELQKEILEYYSGATDK